MTLQSLCERCQKLRIVRTRNDARYVMCQIGLLNRQWPKYPLQPVLRCPHFQENRTRHQSANEDNEAPESETIVKPGS